MNKIKPRERSAIIQSLRAGVVPKIGLQHIQVGRLEEINAMLQDLDNIKTGGASIRFIIGRFGSGKSFFLNLTRIVAIEKNFAVAQADITPDRRLHATGGQARALYTELMHNLATKSRQEGGAVQGIIENWISGIDFDIKQHNGNDNDVAREIHTQLAPLQEFVSGYDFSTVLVDYLNAFLRSDDKTSSCALRWLYGEYSTKTEAHDDLGVRTIITDQTIYDYLKLWGRFLKIAGYSGLLVNLDEMGVLSHRLNNRQARDANYEMILRILNDCLQGNVSNLGFVFAGTDAFLDDNRRGLNSYDALATRLADNQFASNDLKDYSSPVLRLDNLKAEDMFIMLRNIREVFAEGDENKYLIPDEGIKLFLELCAQRLGADFFQTPRDASKTFTGLLSILEQNPTSNWKDVLINTKIIKDDESQIEEANTSDDTQNTEQETAADVQDESKSTKELDQSDFDLRSFKL